MTTGDYASCLASNIRQFVDFCLTFHRINSFFFKLESHIRGVVVILYLRVADNHNLTSSQQYQFSNNRQKLPPDGRNVFAVCHVLI